MHIDSSFCVKHDGELEHGQRNSFLMVIPPGIINNQPVCEVEQTSAHFKEVELFLFG